MERTDLRGKVLTTSELRRILPRASLDTTRATLQVQPLIDQVRSRGAEALYALAEKYDQIRPPYLRIPQKKITSALENLDPNIRAALETSIEAARLGHTQQLPQERTTQIITGGSITQRWLPVQRVGLYVPGGLAVYPSSVVMNAVCAQVAGVPSLAIASPPQKEYEGLPHPTILAACALLGINEVWAIGGAQAIAAFAYGITDGHDTLEPVDVVTGPGNIYVAAAKRALQGTIGIDAEAGTTEIAILADDTADPRYVAADLISQAEHDPAAASVLITSSAKLAEKIQHLVVEYAKETRHTERILTALAGPQSGIIIVDDIEQGLHVVDAYAPEHLEIHTEHANEVALRVHNAGAIFVGSYTPVPLGDYLAGSNHVLPTGGTARFASGLNVMQYLRSQQVVEYTQEALSQVSDHLITLAHAENLPAHGFAADIRRRNLP
ncbi:histidinol dehydrogenase [Schaalia sp. lx-260]|uniref:histidinol dehydrogenase n=1 Tax=Schaalia sp. lx-260 TaxID=2899082 RepID=UPI001E2FD844|nr:histidinol dehydrogenase [Schaalia sp. lx-260]MCD4549887.1 histidinol dehydrogenase [Schaalia sp. lx-260]